ncbi:MAG TPA: hypothetical protein VGR26_11220 [Acidimicrobiales bacterium]|nr:hypothetical protein [Acidimicrobiales bacterium]
MSKPVLDLAGFDLDDVSIELDRPVEEITLEYVAERMSTVRDEVVTCVCARCNNEWMQNLDGSFAGTIDRWVRYPAHRLGSTGLGVVRRYLAKVLWIRLLGEDWTSTPIENGLFSVDVVLNPRFGNSIRRDEMADLTRHLSVAAAQIEADTIFTHAAFTPRVQGQPSRSGIQRFSGGLVVALPALRLQLWLVYRFTPTMTVTWPRSVSWLGPGSRFSQLRRAPLRPEIDDVVLRVS